MKEKVNVMTMSPGKKDYGHHNYPLERIEKAINWLKEHAKDNAHGWFWNLYETGISGSKKIPKRMSQCASGY